MKAILMSGPAGSGKSTWAKKYVEVHNRTHIISSDEIRFELYGKYWLDPKDEKTIIPEMLNRIKHYAEMGEDVIVDVAICKNKARRKWGNRLKQFYKSIELVIIDVPLEVALKQNKCRDRFVPEDVIKQMYGFLGEPDEETVKLFTVIKTVRQEA